MNRPKAVAQRLASAVSEATPLHAGVRQRRTVRAVRGRPGQCFRGGRLWGGNNGDTDTSAVLDEVVPGETSDEDPFESALLDEKDETGIGVLGPF